MTPWERLMELVRAMNAESGGRPAYNEVGSPASGPTGQVAPVYESFAALQDLLHNWSRQAAFAANPDLWRGAWKGAGPNFAISGFAGQDPTLPGLTGDVYIQRGQPLEGDVWYFGHGPPGDEMQGTYGPGSGRGRSRGAGKRKHRRNRR